MKRLSRIQAVVAAAVIGWSVLTASAATWYVGGDGAADTNAGSAAAPWKTIGRAAAKVAAGDTVVVRPGVYPEVVAVKVGGTKAAPVVFRAEPARKARVLGFAVGADYVTIDGFEVTNDKEGGVGVNCGQKHMKNARQGCRVLNNYIHDIQGTGVHSGEHALVKGNTIRKVRRGMFVNSHSLVEGNEVDTLLVQMITKNGKTRPKKTQYAFYAGEKITFRGNYFHGAPVKYLAKGMGVDFFVTWDAWIIGPSRDILIENNRCFNATHASECVAETHKNSSHVTFRNNLFVNTVYVGVLYKHWSHITVVNNTFINCGAYPVWFQNKRETDGSVVKNNLIAYWKHDPSAHGGPKAESGVRNNPVDKDPSATVDCDFNMMWGCNNRGYGEHDFVAEPKFVDPDHGDFRLLPGSPGVDAGATLPAVKTDQNGVKRPQGAGYDVGAYEVKVD